MFQAIGLSSRERRRQDLEPALAGYGPDRGCVDIETLRKRLRADAWAALRKE